VNFKMSNRLRGRRLMEGLRLRVKDLDFDYG
jgi:hypothetical protein